MQSSKTSTEKCRFLANKTSPSSTYKQSKIGENSNLKQCCFFFLQTLTDMERGQSCCSRCTNCIRDHVLVFGFEVDRTHPTLRAHFCVPKSNQKKERLLHIKCFCSVSGDFRDAPVEIFCSEVGCVFTWVRTVVREHVNIFHTIIWFLQFKFVIQTAIVKYTWLSTRKKTTKV